MELNIRNLSVKVLEKEVLSNFNLDIKNHEIHAIMGPNGAGKSTLSNVIMRNKKYDITNGDILFNGKSIINLSTDSVARLGIFLSFQSPVSVDGITNSEFLRSAVLAKNKETFGLYDFMKQMEKSFEELSIPKEMMHRYINDGFSGGERKKNEILQMKILKPKLIILDELDSGLDIDSLRIVAENVINYYNSSSDVSILIITHYPRILELIKPNYVHIMKNGSICQTGDISLAFEIEKNGYVN